MEDSDLRRAWAALAILTAATLLSGAPDAGHAANPKLGPAQLSELGTRTLDQCAASDGEVAGVDAIVAIDASGSSADPAGADIDQDGRVGRLVIRTGGHDPEAGSDDPGDSLLSAQVAASLSLARGLASGDVRLGIVAYSGVIERSRARRARPAGFRNVGPRRQSATPAARKSDVAVESGLTNEVSELEAALDRVLQHGSQGSTDFAAGMRAAQQLLLEARADPGPRRVVLFMSDRGTPVVEADGELRKEDPAVGDAIREAAAAGVVFHAFALGADAAAHPADLEEIASGTGGSFHPVTDLTTLHCQLAAALQP